MMSVVGHQLFHRLLGGGYNSLATAILFYSFVSWSAIARQLTDFGRYLDLKLEDVNGI